MRLFTVLTLCAAVACASCLSMKSADAQAPPSGTAAEYAAILTAAYAADQPGAAVLVARNGEVLFRAAAGMADLELSVPLAPDMVFQIGSITKQFTAAAILMLAEEGRLAISDPLTKHLPDYPAYGSGITVEHLLTHTSGIVSYTGIPGYMAKNVRNDLTVAELIDVFKNLPVEFAPGDRFAYNNSGYILLGAIVEAVSGVPYEEFVRTRIFQPLGMSTAYYGCQTCLIPRRVSGYDGGPDGTINQRYLSFTQPYAAGSLMMTVDDLYRWNQALFGGRVVSAASLERMTTPYALSDGERTTYGYGLGISDVRGRSALRHGGGIFGFVTDALYIPDADVFVVVLSNNATGRVQPGRVATELAALALGDPIPQAPTITLPEDVLRRYVGVYEIRPGFDLTISLEGTQLLAQPTGQRQVRLLPTSSTEFAVDGVEATLRFSSDGADASALTLIQNGQQTVAARKP